jgi:nickel-dependent lactate racemase
MSSSIISRYASKDSFLEDLEIRDVIAAACAARDYHKKRVLMIVPDGTRTCPLGSVFKGVFEEIGAVAAAFDVMIALGTHQPMTEESICDRLEITVEERRTTYRDVRLLNHEWDNPTALRHIDTIARGEIERLTNGLFSIDVPVTINRLIYDYDQIIIAGPVFPHEVVGFSGGNKYLFPGVSGPEVLNFFHWLGALVTNPMIIGNKYTPVRAVVDRAAAMVTVPKLCFCMVVEQSRLAGIFAGPPELAWSSASDLSRELHIRYKDHPFQTVVSCAPAMYDELWVGGKCMYKLEPVVADGGELIIFAPHIKEISLTHGPLIRRVGYHCRDYFWKRWDQYKEMPWGVLAHSTHVRGIGSYEDGVEKCRIQVTLASGIPEEICKKVNLGYRDPRSIVPEDFAGREEEGVLLVPKAGETLYHLRKRPDWAREM